MNLSLRIKTMKYFFTRRKISDKKTMKNNTIKITAPTWNDGFELSNGSYSVPHNQDYIKYIIKNMKH